MAKMTSRWILLSYGVGDARTPLGFIFLSACDKSVWGSASPLGAGIPAGPSPLYPCWAKEARRKPLLRSRRGQKQTVAHWPYVRVCVRMCRCWWAGVMWQGGKLGMCPFQNKIKYFEMTIVGLSFLSSSPLPMFPLCVSQAPLHHQLGCLGHSVPWFPQPSNGSNSACLLYSVLRKDKYHIQSSWNKKK